MTNAGYTGSINLCCNNYNSQYSVQNQNEENGFSETSPLLAERQNNVHIYDSIFLTFLLIIFLAGLSTGLYLLAREGHEWKTSEVYNLTSREFWQAHVPSSTMPRLKLPSATVLFLPTNSSSCDSKSLCAKLVHELQLKHMSQWKEPDIVYNFLVSADGNIFEGRGWDFQTTVHDYSSTETITVAFLGKFDNDPPTQKQAESAKLFIDVAVMEGKLETCYNIMIWEENKFFIDIARNIQDRRSNC